MAWGLRRQVESHDWRLSASEEDRREYDAFGPWIYDIKAERDIPKRFRAVCERHRDARFLLKVPRGVDRRDAHPGMDLYVAMLAVHDHGASLMRLTGEDVATQDIIWDELAALESYVNLLIGRWTLMLRDGGAFVVDYNAVSSGLMDKVTEFVRSRWILRGEAPRAVEPDPVVDVADHYFSNELYVKRRSGPQPVAPIHVEPKNRLCRDEANRRRLSTGVMFLDAPDELIIVNRGKPTRRFFETRCARNCIFVPYAGLTSFTLASPPADRPARFHELTLRLDKQVIRQFCLLAPERVLARLAAHGAPRSAPTAPTCRSRRRRFSAD
jgi:hypothetical protein